MNPPLVSSLHAAAPAVTVPQPALVVVVHAENSAVPLARERVSSDDLSDHVTEAWRDGCLRRRFPGVARADLALRLRPLRADEAGLRCHGFALEATLPDGRTSSTSFSVSSLRAVAERAVDRLLALGKLKRGQGYAYELHCQPTAVPAPPSPAPVEFDVSDLSPALPWLEVPLRPLVAQAIPHDTLAEDAFHVFITAGAFARAEQFARQGSRANPPVETGAAFLGVPCSCPETGDFFVVVTDAFEVIGAQESAYALRYTDQSFGRIRAVLTARQAISPALRLVGQAHGHNFLPADGKTCAACPTRAVCDLTNLFASSDDQTWTRAVFAGAPYALCLIFGLTARGDRVHGLFTQHDAQLRQRGFLEIADFNLEHWECRGAASR